MRPTCLQWRSPHEKTPEYLLPTVTNDGRKLNFLNPKTKEIKKRGGTFSKTSRFGQYNNWARQTGGTFLGPGTYNGQAQLTTLVKKPCSVVFKRFEQGKNCTQNAYMMFGNHLVYQPNLINAKEKCSKAGFQTEQCSVDLMAVLSKRTIEESRKHGSIGKLSNSPSPKPKPGSALIETSINNANLYGCSTTAKHISDSRPRTSTEGVRLGVRGGLTDATQSPGNEMEEIHTRNNASPQQIKSKNKYARANTTVKGIDQNQSDLELKRRSRSTLNNSKNKKLGYSSVRARPFLMYKQKSPYGMLHIHDVHSFIKKGMNSYTPSTGAARKYIPISMTTTTRSFVDNPELLKRRLGRGSRKNELWNDEGGSGTASRNEMDRENSDLVMFNQTLGSNPHNGLSNLANTQPINPPKQTLLFIGHPHLNILLLWYSIVLILYMLTSIFL